MERDTWGGVLYTGTKYIIPGIWYRVLRAKQWTSYTIRYKVRRTRYMTRDTRYNGKLHGTRYRVQGTEYMEHDWYKVQGRRQMVHETNKVHGMVTQVTRI